MTERQSILDPGSVCARVGRERSSGLYYEVLGSPTTCSVPILFIHGGGGTGYTYRRTLDGRPGWADVLAERGFEVWVTDWPGSGRSGPRDGLTLEYADVVEGFEALLKDVIGVPCILSAHSMGGAIAWKLVEIVPHLIAGVVGTASAYPGNLSQPSEILSDDGTVVQLRFSDTGVPFRIDRSRPYVYDENYILRQAVAGSTQMPEGAVETLLRFPGVMSPRLVLQRVGVLPGMPVIENPEGFRDKPIRLVTGEFDPAHTREIEERTRQLLSDWGADAQLVWLPDRGVRGNGHYLMGELNAYEVLDVVQEQFLEIAARASQHQGAAG